MVSLQLKMTVGGEADNWNMMIVILLFGALTLCRYEGKGVFLSSAWRQMLNLRMKN